MEFSYRSRLQYVEKLEKTRQENIEQTMSFLSESDPEWGVNSDKKANENMVEEFLLRSTPYINKFYQLREIILTNPCGSDIRKAAQRDCTKVHREFLDEFGRELHPSSKDVERRRKEKNKQFLKDARMVALAPEKCVSCERERCIIDETKESQYVCTECGYVERYGIAHGINGLTFEETKNLPPEPYTYKPISHLEDLLMQVQGKSSRVIPPELLVRIRREFRKSRVPDNLITPTRVRYVLRKIGATNYYEEVTAIAHKVNPAFKPIVIKDQHYEKLKLMFTEVYRQFPTAVAEISPKRRNFLSYHGFTKAMCIFLGFHEYVRAFTSLKSHKKRQAQSKILESIFSRMNFEFRYSD